MCRGVARGASALAVMVLSLALAAAPGLTPASGDEAPAAKERRRERVALTEEALALHSQALVVDGHNDLPYRLRELTQGNFRLLDLRQPQPKLHTDIGRLRRGGVDAQFWSAYVDAEEYRGPAAVKATLEQIALIHQMVQTYPDVFALADTADDIVRLSQAGKVASLIGVEGGHAIDNSLDVLRTYRRLGVRYMTLTHSVTLDWADSATDQRRHGGLTRFGEEVVREMNRLGILVDISHVSPETMRHAIRVSQAPVIASHSSAYALAEHPRNVPDDVLRLLRDKDGVVMVNFFPGFLLPEGVRASAEGFQVWRKLKQQYADPARVQEAWLAWRREHPIPRGSVHHVVDHIEHIARVAGLDHVGLGSDYDGIDATPEQLEDVACFPYITQELINRGYSREAIFKILGGNLLRVLRKADKTAQRLSANMN